MDLRWQSFHTAAQVYKGRVNNPVIPSVDEFTGDSSKTGQEVPEALSDLRDLMRVHVIQ